jgi:hypothetical protein
MYLQVCIGTDFCISRPAFLPKLGPGIVDPKSIWVILLQEEVLNVRILERSNAAFAKRKKEPTELTPTVGIIQPQSLLEWEKDRAVACLVYKMDR